MRTHSAQLPAVLRAGTFDSQWVVDVFYDNERKAQDVEVSEVSLLEDGTAKVQQSGSLVVTWTDYLGRSLAPRSMEDLLSPFGTTLVLYKLISNGPLFAERVTMGTFTVSDTPTIQTVGWRFGSLHLSKGDRVKVAFKDLFYKVQRNRFDLPGVTPSLVSVYTEIQRLTRLPVTRSPYVPDGPIPRALIYPEDRLDAVYQLASILDATPYMTPDGTVSLRPRTWTPQVDEIAADGAEGGEVVEVPPVYSAWATERVNLWTNPRAVSGGTAFGSPSSGTVGYITDFPGPVTTARRWTSAGTSNARIHVLPLGLDTPDQGEQAHVLLHVIIAGGTLNAANIAVRPSDVGSSTNATVQSFGNLGPGEYTLELKLTTNAAAAAAAGGVVFIGAGSVAGMTVDATEFHVEAVTDGGYIDGESPDSALAQVVWEGTPHASRTLQQVRAIDVPGYELVGERKPGTLVSVQRGMSADGVYNRVVVRAQGQNPRVLAVGELTSGVLRARNVDGSDSPFGRVPYFVSSQYITTPTQAQEEVQRTLPRVARPQATVLEIEELENPLREVGDVVEVIRVGERFPARVVAVRRSMSKVQTTSVVVAS